MKQGLALAIFLGAAGLAGAAYAQQTPPPIGPYAATQQPADARPRTMRRRPRAN